ncbi:lysylphosphatidylglycerol synthase transmembrane domain-containing protein [Alphaproteobacteria bacterium]|nr:lysylphosphatidylglycerol synthase transmembrane domain-containing protein [Alphaproteobacteria bacterium]
MKKWLAIALKFCVSGFLIWFLLQGIDMGTAIARLQSVDPAMLFVAISIIFLQIIIGGFRWQAVQKAIDLPFAFLTSLKFFYIGMFFNQTLPSSVGGDAVRIFLVYKNGINLRGAINGVMLERISAVIGMILLIDVMLVFNFSHIRATEHTWFFPAVGILSIFFIVGLITLMGLDKLPKWLRKWKLIKGIGNLAIDARAVFLRPQHSVIVIFWGCVTAMNISTIVYILALGLNLNIAWLDCLLLVPPALLVTTLPISIGGWGVREGALVATLAIAGVPPEGALVLSMLVGLVTVVISLPGGILWLIGKEKGSQINLEEIEQTVTNTEK